MAIGENLSYAIPEEFLESFSGFINVLEALGIIIIAYLVFNVVNMILNRKKREEMKKINDNLEDIKRILSKKSKR